MSALLEARSLLMEGIVESNGSGREAARKFGISPALLSLIGKAKRTLADDLKTKACEMSMKSALAIIMEYTGLNRLFNYNRTDRNLHNMLQKIRKEDREADTARERIADRLIDKPTDEYLTAQDIEETRVDIVEMADLTAATVDLITEMDSRYQSLKIGELLREKEKRH